MSDKTNKSKPFAIPDDLEITDSHLIDDLKTSNAAIRKEKTVTGQFVKEKSIEGETLDEKSVTGTVEEESLQEAEIIKETNEKDREPEALDFKELTIKAKTAPKESKIKEKKSKEKKSKEMKKRKKAQETDVPQFEAEDKATLSKTGTRSKVIMPDEDLSHPNIQADTGTDKDLELGEPIDDEASLSGFQVNENKVEEEPDKVKAVNIDESEITSTDIMEESRHIPDPEMSDEIPSASLAELHVPEQKFAAGHPDGKRKPTGIQKKDKGKPQMAALNNTQATQGGKSSTTTLLVALIALFASLYSLMIALPSEDAGQNSDSNFAKTIQQNNREIQALQRKVIDLEEQIRALNPTVKTRKLSSIKKSSSKRRTAKKRYVPRKTKSYKRRYVPKKKKYRKKTTSKYRRR